MKCDCVLSEKKLKTRLTFRSIAPYKYYGRQQEQTANEILHSLSYLMNT